MKSKLFFCILGLTTSLTGFANPYSTYDLNFIAPTVTSKAAVGSAEVGLIVYDNSDNKVYVKDGLGSWQELTPATNTAVSTSSTSRKIATATILVSSGSASVLRQDGSWISSVTYNGTGDTTINITSGTFGSAPNCVVSNILNNAQGRFFFAPTTSAVRWQSFTGLGVFQDGDYTIMCVGEP